MTIKDLRQMKKNEALNKIIKAHGSNGAKIYFDEYDYSDMGCQRDYYVDDVLDNLRRELKRIDEM